MATFSSVAVGGKVFAAQMNSIIAYINGGSYVWADAAERTAQTGMTVGAKGTQTDTGVTYRYWGVSIGWISEPGPAFQVGRGSAQSITGGAWTLVSSAWGTPGLNQGMTSFASGVLTVAVTGWYRLSFYIRWVSIPTVLAAQLTVNSTSVDTSATVASDDRRNTSSQVSACAPALVFLTAGDALRLYVFSTSTQNLGANPRDVNLSVEFVRAV